MKVVCDRDQMFSAFQTASSVAPARSPKPILQNVKLVASPEATVLEGTDLETGVRVNVQGVQVSAPGSAILSPRLGAILRESSDAALHLETDGQAVLVKGERSEFRLPAENPDEFPEVAAFGETKYQELAAPLLRELIRRTVFATDNESSRYALGGVLLEFGPDTITGVGTDGRRLARMVGPAKSVGGHDAGATSTIVPTRAMHLIERAIADSTGTVQLAARGNDILVNDQRFTIYSRLVEGRFPKWRDVFPKRDGATRVDLLVGPLHAAVRQAAIATNNDSRGVDFSFGDGKLVLSGKAADVGQSRVELPISYDGPPMTLTLDPRFVADFLKVLDDDSQVAVDIKGPEIACVLSAGEEYAYVIMPLVRDR